MEPDSLKGLRSNYGAENSAGDGFVELQVQRSSIEKLPELGSIPSDYVDIVSTYLKERAQKAYREDSQLEKPSTHSLRQLYQAIPEKEVLEKILRASELENGEIAELAELLAYLADAQLTEGIRQLFHNREINAPSKEEVAVADIAEGWHSIKLDLQARFLLALFRQDKDCNLSTRAFLLMGAGYAKGCPLSNKQNLPVQNGFVISPGDIVLYFTDIGIGLEKTEILKEECWLFSHAPRRQEVIGLSDGQSETIPLDSPISRNVKDEIFVSIRPGRNKLLATQKNLSPEQRLILLYLDRTFGHEFKHRDWQIVLSQLEADTSVTELNVCVQQIANTAVELKLPVSYLLRAAFRLIAHSMELVRDQSSWPQENILASFPRSLLRINSLMRMACAGKEEDAGRLEIENIVSSNMYARAIAFQRICDCDWPIRTVPSGEMHTELDEWQRSWVQGLFGKEAIEGDLSGSREEPPLVGLEVIRSIIPNPENLSNALEIAKSSGLGVLSLLDLCSAIASAGRVEILNSLLTQCSDFAGSQPFRFEGYQSYPSTHLLCNIFTSAGASNKWRQLPGLFLKLATILPSEAEEKICKIVCTAVQRGSGIQRSIRMPNSEAIAELITNWPIDKLGEEAMVTLFSLTYNPLRKKDIQEVYQLAANHAQKNGLEIAEVLNTGLSGINRAGLLRGVPHLRHLFDRHSEIPEDFRVMLEMKAKSNTEYFIQCLGSNNPVISRAIMTLYRDYGPAAGEEVLAYFDFNNIRGESSIKEIPALMLMICQRGPAPLVADLSQLEELVPDKTRRGKIFFNLLRTEQDLRALSELAGKLKTRGVGQQFVEALQTIDLEAFDSPNSVEVILLKYYLEQSSDLRGLMPVVCALLAEVEDDSIRTEIFSDVLKTLTKSTSDKSIKLREGIRVDRKFFEICTFGATRTLPHAGWRTLFVAVHRHQNPGMALSEASAALLDWSETYCGDREEKSKLARREIILKHGWRFLAELSERSASWKKPFSLLPIYPYYSCSEIETALAIFEEAAVTIVEGDSKSILEYGGYSGVEGRRKLDEDLQEAMSVFFTNGGVSEDYFYKTESNNRTNQSREFARFKDCVERCLGESHEEEYFSALYARWNPRLRLAEKGNGGSRLEYTTIFFHTALAETLLHKQRKDELGPALLALPEFLDREHVRNHPDVFAAIVRQLGELRKMSETIADHEAKDFRFLAGWQDTRACLESAEKYLRTFGPRTAPVICGLFALVENSIPSKYWTHFLGLSSQDLLLPERFENTDELVSFLTTRRLRLVERYWGFEELPDSITPLERELLMSAIGHDNLDFMDWSPSYQNRRYALLKRAEDTAAEVGSYRPYFPERILGDDLNLYGYVAPGTQSELMRDQTFERTLQVYLVGELLSTAAAPRKASFSEGELDLEDLNIPSGGTKISAAEIQVQNRIERKEMGRAATISEALKIKSKLKQAMSLDEACEVLRVAIEVELSGELAKNKNAQRNLKRDEKKLKAALVRAKDLESALSDIKSATPLELLTLIAHNKKWMKNSGIRSSVQSFLFAAVGSDRTAGEIESRSGSLETAAILQAKNIIARTKNKWLALIAQQASHKSPKPTISTKDAEQFIDFVLNGKGFKDAEANMKGEAGEIMLPRQLYLSRGWEFRLMAVFGNTCALRDPEPQSKRANMGFVPFFVPDASIREPLFRGGTGLLAVQATDADGKDCRVLLIRSFNPSSMELEQVHSESLFERVVDYLADKAELAGFDYIAIPNHGHNYTISNRSLLRDYVESNYPGSNPKDVLKLTNPEAGLYNQELLIRPCIVVRRIRRP